jgi:hypothetical protein
MCKSVSGSNEVESTYYKNFSTKCCKNVQPIILLIVGIAMVAFCSYSVHAYPDMQPFAAKWCLAMGCITTVSSIIWLVANLRIQKLFREPDRTHLDARGNISRCV